MCMNNVEYMKAIDYTDAMLLVPKHNVKAKQIYVYFSETEKLQRQ